MTPDARPAGRMQRMLWIGGLAGLAGLLLLFLLFRLPDSRLYWEYGGRILGGAYVPGYVEWVQHRVGNPASALMALPQPALIPYTGFSCEYPPGALLLFSAVRAVADGRESFAIGFASLIAVLTFASVFLAYRMAGPDRLPRLPAIGVAFAVVLWPLVIGGGFLIGRFDIAPTVLAMIAIWLWSRDRAWAGALCCGLGGAIKLWPMFVVPLFAMERWRAGRFGEAVLICAAGTIGFAIPHLAMFPLGTHPADVLSYLGYLRDRPLEIESMAANAIVLLAGPLGIKPTVNLDYGSINIVFAGQAGIIKALGLANALILAGSYLAFWLLVPKTPDRDRRQLLLIATTGVILVGTVLTSRVFSGEYMIWFFPFVLAAVRGRAGAIGLVAYLLSCVLLRLAYYYWFPLTQMDPPFATGVSLAKNVALLGVGIAFAVTMAGAGRKAAVAARP